VRCEQEVVEAHRRLRGVGVSVCVLGADCGGVEEACRGYGVAREAEDVERGEIDGEPDGRFAEVVGNGLRVERSTPGVAVPSVFAAGRTGQVRGAQGRHIPAQEVHPSQDTRDGLRKRFPLVVGHGGRRMSECGRHAEETRADWEVHPRAMRALQDIAIAAEQRVALRWCGRVRHGRDGLRRAHAHNGGQRVPVCHKGARAPAQ
jgi:hypothetical protein